MLFSTSYITTGCFTNLYILSFIPPITPLYTKPSLFRSCISASLSSPSLLCHRFFSLRLLAPSVIASRFSPSCLLSTISPIPLLYQSIIHRSYHHPFPLFILFYFSSFLSLFLLTSLLITACFSPPCLLFIILSQSCLPHSFSAMPSLFLFSHGSLFLFSHFFPIPIQSWLFFPIPFILKRYHAFPHPSHLVPVAPESPSSSDNPAGAHRLTGEATRWVRLVQG